MVHQLAISCKYFRQRWLSCPLMHEYKHIHLWTSAVTKVSVLLTRWRNRQSKSFCDSANCVTVALPSDSQGSKTVKLMDATEKLSRRQRHLECCTKQCKSLQMLSRRSLPHMADPPGADCSLAAAENQSRLVGQCKNAPLGLWGRSCEHSTFSCFCVAQSIVLVLRFILT